MPACQRRQESKKWHTSLVLDNQQVKRIIEMAQLCVSADQHIRPTIDEFIDMVNEKETMTTVVSPVCGHSRSNSGSSLKQVYEHSMLIISSGERYAFSNLCLYKIPTLGFITYICYS
jgi:hypothetical protein